MNAADEPRYIRLKQLLAFSRKYDPAISGLPALKESFNKLRLIRAEMLSNERILLKGTKPWKQKKDDAKNTLSVMGEILAGALFSLGHDNRDDKFRDKWKASPSALNAMAEDQLINFIKEAAAAAETNITKLNRYLISPEFVASVRDTLARFQKSGKDLKTRIEDLHTIREKNKTLYPQISEIIHKELNQRIYPLAASDPEIYKQYKQECGMPRCIRMECREDESE